MWFVSCSTKCWFASYANNNTIYNAGDNINKVIFSLQKLSKKLLKWFFNNQMKSNSDKWAKVFKSGLSKFCGRQPLKNLKGYGFNWLYTLKFFKGSLRQNLLSPVLNTLSKMLFNSLNTKVAIIYRNQSIDLVCK